MGFLRDASVTKRKVMLRLYIALSLIKVERLYRTTDMICPCGNTRPQRYGCGHIYKW